LKDWKNPIDNGMDMPWCTLPWQTYAVRVALNGLYTCYEKYKTLIFSTELDGMAHLFLKDALDYQLQRAMDMVIAMSKMQKRPMLPTVDEVTEQKSEQKNDSKSDKK
jgi:hypothetical protein